MINVSKGVLTRIGMRFLPYIPLYIFSPFYLF